MRKPAPSSPSLDLLRGFEAAARKSSFTEAASELFLTQSAVSRQIKTLEERIGVRLFIRRSRGLALTEAGEALYRSVCAALAQISAGIERARRTQRAPVLNVTASIAFSALWLVPRLPRFRALRPDVDVRLSATSELLDLERHAIDVAVRYCAPEAVPDGAVKLFGGEVVPVCAPRVAADPARPFKRPEDLARHVLLHYDEPLHRLPWHSWSTWLEAAGIPDLRPAGALHFSHLDHAIRAAVAGEGVALGIRAVLQDLFARGELVMPFARTFPTNRSYFAIIAPQAQSLPEANQFVEWLLREVAETGISSETPHTGAVPTDRQMKPWRRAGTAKRAAASDQKARRRMKTPIGGARP